MFLHDVCVMSRRLASVSSSSSQQEVSLAIGLAMGTPLRYAKHCTVRYLKEKSARFVCSLSPLVVVVVFRPTYSSANRKGSLHPLRRVQGVHPKIHATTAALLVFSRACGCFSSFTTAVWCGLVRCDVAYFRFGCIIKRKKKRTSSSYGRPQKCHSLEGQKPDWN